MKPATLPPLDYRPFAFIPVGEATERTDAHVWREWDRAVIDLDAIKAQGLNSEAHSRELLRAHQQRMHAEFVREVNL
jgi:hypothetical protein